MSRQQKGLLLLLLDNFLLVFAFLWTNAMLAGSVSMWSVLPLALPYLAVMLPVATFFILVFGIHRLQLNYYERRAMFHTSIVAIFSALSGLGVSAFMGAGISVQFFVVVAMSFMLLSAATRLVLRELVVAIYQNYRGSIRVLIYGAGRTGQQLAAALITDEEIKPIAFVDDERALHGLTISGLRVFSSRDLEQRIQDMSIDRIILAMPSVSESEQAVIAERLSHLACEVHAMPSFASLVMNKQSIQSTQPLDFSKLLGRVNLEAELPGVRDMYRGKSVLVTGAGGSIGAELCLQVAGSRPERIILFDHSEYALYAISRKLETRFPDVEQVCVLGSVCHEPLVSHVFEAHNVNVVLHAAAYKHLPMVEMNAIEGLRNNVLGTRIVAVTAMRYEVDSFILISTDKAVRPISWLGYSKRFAEMLIQDLSTRSGKTAMSMVRFGNVLGSSGSVVPLFQEQIAKGGPVTLTHQDVTRYFMTISEAVRLVLLASSFSRGGDVFVLDMGKPVPIRELARNLIEANGYTVRDAAHPNGDIEIFVTGLRDGEKIREELLIGSDMLTTLHPKILRAQEIQPSELEMATIMSEIKRIIEQYDEEELENLSEKWAHFLGKDHDRLALEASESADA